jgi:redox-sensing transcriptional repressor
MSPSGPISSPTLARLPTYIRCLREFVASGGLLIPSDELAIAASVHPTQVRRDLALFAVGTAGIGYPARELLAHLESLLGLHGSTEAVIVGAGNLGSALAAYPGFAQYGLTILALFDADPAKVGTQVDGKPVLALEKLATLPARLGLKIGIICVPADQAQAVADLMVAAGIIAIWNFAPVQLKVPTHVYVRQEDLAAQLALLSYHVQQSGLVQSARARRPGETASGHDLEVSADND